MNGGIKRSIDGMVPKLPAEESIVPLAEAPAVSGELAWEAPNFERNFGGPKIAVFLLIALALTGYSVWQRDWFVVGIIPLVAVVSLWYLKSSKPINMTYRVEPLGIYEGEKFHPFSGIHSFWLVYNEKVQRLYLAFDRKYLPALDINIKGVDVVALREALGERIPEETKRTESFLDKTIRLIGF